MSEGRMKEHDRFQNALRAWKAQTADAQPPPEIEQRVMRHFARRPAHRWRFYALGGAVAAAIALAVWMRPAPPAAPTEPPDFVAIPFVIQPAPYERVEIVRTEVSAAELIAVGFPVSGDPSARLQADLLVGQDGRARAVRLIPNQYGPEEESE